MPHKYVEIAFTETVRKVQEEMNSRASYAKMDKGEDYNHLLSENEAQFIQARDSFYMASVSETDWPYVQHRGGPKGFVKVIDASTIGFSDYSGNRQYVSTGNFRTNNRVALFFMDYPNQRRLKMLGRIETVSEDDWETLAKLESEGYRAAVERAFVIKIEGFDWNCPQHITPRFSEHELREVLNPLIEENENLKRELQDIQREKKTVASNGMAAGNGDLPLVVSGIRQLTPRVRAYEFRHVDGEALPEVGAGAHLKIPVQLNNGETDFHYYSISSNPARRDIYEIAVLREDDGQGGSLSVHENLQLGAKINCDLPGNFFPLHSDSRPAVLIAGGIGITPIKPMAQTLLARATKFELHYAGRSENDMAYRDRLARDLNGYVYFYPKDKKQRMDLTNILNNAQSDTVFYVCGPERLISEVKRIASEQGISADRVCSEQFSSPSQEVNQPLEVKLASSQQIIQVAESESVLDALNASDANVPYSCKTGQCKTCVVKVLEGEPDHRDSCLSESEKQQGMMCPCVSRAKGGRLVLDI